MSNFNTGIFSKPRYSAFPWSHGNRISMDAGKIVPIAWDYLDTGEKFALDSVGNVTRIAPMLAPTLDTYKTDIHAFAVRLRTIAMASRNPWKYEDFFNLNRNADGSLKLPMVPLDFLIGVNRFRNNTFFEAMGLPTFKNLREEYLQFIRTRCPWVFDTIAKCLVTVNSGTQTNTVTVLPVSLTEAVSSLLNLDDIQQPFKYLGTDYYYKGNDTTFAHSQLPFSDTFINWVFNHSSYKSTIQRRIAQRFSNSIDEYRFGFTVSAPSDACRVSDGDVLNIGELLYDELKVDTVTLMNEYIEYLLDYFWVMRSDGENLASSYPVLYDLGNGPSSVGYSLLTSLSANFPDLPTQTITIYSNSSQSTYNRTCVLIPSYPFEAYWKIISDWFINTALFEPDTYFLDNTRAFGDWQSCDDYDSWESYVRDLQEAMSFANRYWKNDYFTSCFPSAQVGNAVSIPVNGTIVDLRNANAMQKLKERLLYAGQRFRDVLYSITGKRTSSAIMDMSEVLGMWSNNINVDSVLQNSSSENGQPLANYAGTGLGYRSGGKGCYYVAEEPTVIMFVASITPRASYFQGVHKKLMRGNVYDYDIPQLANIGEEVVRIGELYFDADSPTIQSASQSIFGYQRRNGSFMWTPDEVHGDFRGSLDYWHNARVFGSKPTLSQSFLEFRPASDNLNRIWAVTSDSVNHFYCHFTFDGAIIRHLPKHVHYDL